jgi:D-serine deaminase-like pyridoxal phosphate-dependent protein
MDWYTITNAETLDTPALAIYPDRVRKNIDTLVHSIDNVARLRPHIKTHKSPEVARWMMAAGINKFKCATIAEAEMLATVGAPDVLLAYQPVGPKANRLAELVHRFPGTRFSCLVDNADVARHIDRVFGEHGQSIEAYIDLNVGMNRTGIVPTLALALYEACLPMKHLTITGLHAYDGHLRDPDLKIRKAQCDEGYAAVPPLQQAIEKKHGRHLVIVAGGTPSYSIHSQRPEIECSPGTYIYWDKNYEQTLQEQHYLHAALVVTRVVSLPSPGTICVDLGHKAIASENPLDKRVFFLNAPNLRPTGHSEEHMVFAIPEDAQYKVGDILYGVPFHVCPTVALHDQPAVVEDRQVKTYWRTLARNRKITV